MADFRIDIIADPVCPWCYLGFKRLQQAIEQLGDDYRFDLQWQPFELHPDLPSAGVDKERYLIRKFGSAERLYEAHHALQQVGAHEGIEFNFSDRDILPNTFLSHQLLYQANKANLGTALALALFYAYFTQSKPIGRREVLIDIATTVGLTQTQIDDAFSDKTASLVTQKMSRLKQAEIHSVPTYVINDKYVLQGAQPAEIFVKFFTDLAK